MSSILLTGFQGSGKTTVGKSMAARGFGPCIDTDELLLEQTGFQSVRELHQSVGEEAFRQLEVQVLSALRPDVSSVIALGGGTLLHSACQASARRLGRIIYLFLPRDKLKVDPQAPFIVGRSLPEFFEERDALYTRCADFRLDISGLSPDSVAECIEKEMYSEFQRRL